MRTDKTGPRPGGDAAVKSRAPEDVGTPIVEQWVCKEFVLHDKLLEDG